MVKKKYLQFFAIQTVSRQYEEYNTLYIENSSRHVRMEQTKIRRIFKSISNLMFRIGCAIAKSNYYACQ